jgi:NADH-quinone oxidoreductase subunit L
MDTGTVLRNLLTLAWLLPLAGFVAEIYALQLRWSHRLSKAPAQLAVACIGAGFLCSLSALLYWSVQTDWVGWKPAHHGHRADEHAGDHHAEEHVAPADAMHPSDPAEHVAADDAHGHDATHEPKFYAGTFYKLATFGNLEISLDWYIDSLTLVMFTMVTFIATCIHLFAMGYMKDELTEEYEDHEVHLPGGHHFTRPGRFHRFFAFLSLFCFAMLGLVLAGNIFQVFIFWELVGVCSFLLIGFYVERHSASTAANKAFIMNRVGDFGFLIGLMILITSFGTFRFFDTNDGHIEQTGLFSMVRGNDGKLDVSDDKSVVNAVVYLRDSHGHRLADGTTPKTISYLLLIAAGLGVFAGSIGKSAQFPLQTWLPDAMEGPTPVSALVHSATMVAAGVYLAGRFYPMFPPEVLLGIAYIGCITAFLAATIAIVATDIKKVLAYSTISQLGYMMLGIGVGGWGAGLFHLITHAFFKSLMFLASGSVIAGCHHEQDMRKMGGLRHKMPITAYTMLVGVIAIAGLAIPGISIFGHAIAFSGFHSKDAIVATALAFTELNPNSMHGILFIVPLVTAGITAFYMFRLWFMTFAGEPRDEHVYEHAHENPIIMTGPLLVLSLLAAGCALGGESGWLFSLLSYSEAFPLHEALSSSRVTELVIPSHADVLSVHGTAGMLALIAAFTGTTVAYLIYCRKAVNPDDIRRQAGGVYDFLVDKWRFDTLYDVAFVRPAHAVGYWCQTFDRCVLDVVLHASATITIVVSRWERMFDEGMIDGLVNLVGNTTVQVGRSLRIVQTGQLRQYVMWIAVGVVVLFAALFTTLPK